MSDNNKMMDEGCTCADYGRNIPPSTFLYFIIYRPCYFSINFKLNKLDHFTYLNYSFGHVGYSPKVWN